MKAASIQELKQEMQQTGNTRLVELCLRLARFKKENKELLTYLLFESHNEEGYVQSVKLVMDEEFAELPKSSVYLTKKSLRKILRITGRHIKYTASKQAEAALLIYFCQRMKAIVPGITRNAVLHNLYTQQIKKINTALATLHEDLRYDFLKELEELSLEEDSAISKLFGKRKGR